MPRDYRPCFDRRVGRIPPHTWGSEDSFKYKVGARVRQPPRVGPGAYDAAIPSVRTHAPGTRSAWAMSKVPKVQYNAVKRVPEQLIAYKLDPGMAAVVLGSARTYRTAFRPSGPRIARHATESDMKHRCPSAHGQVHRRGGPAVGSYQLAATTIGARAQLAAARPSSAFARHGSNRAEEARWRSSGSQILRADRDLLGELQGRRPSGRQQRAARPRPRSAPAAGRRPAPRAVRRGPERVVPRPLAAGDQFRTHSLARERFVLLDSGPKAGIVAAAENSARSYARVFGKSTPRQWAY
eukprot:g3532.t1